MTDTAVATQTRTPKPPLEAGKGIAAIVPSTAEQVFRMADAIARSGMAPNGMNTPEKLTIAIFHGLEVGLPPMQAVQSIAVINGRPTVWGDAAIGLVRGSGLCEWIEETIEGEGDQRVAACSTQRTGEKRPVTRSFSVADAKAAGLWGKQGPWKQYPDRMLQMRARSFCLRDAYADVLKGLSIREEVRDYSGPTIDARAGEADQAASVSAALREAAAKKDDPQPAEPDQPVDPNKVIDVEDQGAPEPWRAAIDTAATAYRAAATMDALTAAVKAAKPHIDALPDSEAGDLARQELGALAQERKAALAQGGDLLDDGKG